MSNLIHKVKDAVTGEHHHHRDKDDDHPSVSNTTNDSEDTSDSVAHGSHISPTNPGILHSTTKGIHGLRDGGTASGLASSGDNSRLTGTTWGAHAGKSSAPGGSYDSVAHGSSISPTNPGVSDSTTAGIHGQRDSGTGITPGFEERERRGIDLHHVGTVPGATGGSNSAGRSGSGVAVPAEGAEPPAVGNFTTITAGDDNNDNLPASGYAGPTSPTTSSSASRNGGQSYVPGTGLTAGPGAEAPNSENNVSGTGYDGGVRR